jgi:hypothetical protein
MYSRSFDPNASVVLDSTFSSDSTPSKACDIKANSLKLNTIQVRIYRVIHDLMTLLQEVNHPVYGFIFLISALEGRGYRSPYRRRLASLAGNSSRKRHYVIF